MRRLVIGAVLATVMFAGVGTGVAFAHPAGAVASQHVHEPALFALGTANANGQAGIIQGFVVHSLTCLAHPDSDH